MGKRERNKKKGARDLEDADDLAHVLLADAPDSASAVQIVGRRADDPEVEHVRHAREVQPPRRPR
eukprot:1034523-Rhodomonas_salina.1